MRGNQYKNLSTTRWPPESLQRNQEPPELGRNVYAFKRVRAAWPATKSYETEQMPGLTFAGEVCENRYESRTQIIAPMMKKRVAIRRRVNKKEIN